MTHELRTETQIYVHWGKGGESVPDKQTHRDRSLLEKGIKMSEGNGKLKKAVSLEHRKHGMRL